MGCVQNRLRERAKPVPTNIPAPPRIVSPEVAELAKTIQLAQLAYTKKKADIIWEKLKVAAPLSAETILRDGRPCFRYKMEDAGVASMGSNEGQVCTMIATRLNAEHAGLEAIAKKTREDDHWRVLVYIPLGNSM